MNGELCTSHKTRSVKFGITEFLPSVALQGDAAGGAILSRSVALANRPPDVVPNLGADAERDVEVARLVHVAHVDREFGDLYGVCACGARSLPFALRVDAERWSCPYLAAVEEVAAAVGLYLQRVSDATLAGYVR